MKSRFDLFLFDLDGTLVDSLGDLTSAANHVRASFGFAPLPPDAVRSFIGNGVSALMDLVVPGIPSSEQARALAMFVDYYGSHLLDTTKLYDGIPAFLSRCPARKAVLTNKQESFARKILTGLSVSEDFAMVWGGDTGPWKKPSPDPINAMLSALKVAPQRAVMIGDGVNDVLAAKAAGVFSVAVGYGYCDRNELIALHPDCYVGDARELLEAPCFG